VLTIPSTVKALERNTNSEPEATTTVNCDSKREVQSKVTANSTMTLSASPKNRHYSYKNKEKNSPMKRPNLRFEQKKQQQQEGQFVSFDLNPSPKGLIHSTQIKKRKKQQRKQFVVKSRETKPVNRQSLTTLR